MDLMKSTTSIQYKTHEVIENYSELEENEKTNKEHRGLRKYYQNLEEKGSSIPIAYDDFLNNKQKKILKENNQEKINEDILNILLNLNKEKNFIEEKLAELEKRLSDSETANENLQYEKEKLKTDLSKIYHEVKIAQSGLKNMNLDDNSSHIQFDTNSKKVASSEKEKDANLKTEIKFLINKLLKAKGKLVKDKNDLSFKESNYKSGNSIVLNSSTYDYNIKPNRTSEKKQNLKQNNYESSEILENTRSKTPQIYKESRTKDYFYVKENVKKI